MNNNDKLLILNVGGTFNKVYNTISGELEVPKNNLAIEDILKRSLNNQIDVDGIIYKDSLDMDEDDRSELARYINNCNYSKVVIVHGTDTMDQSASYLENNINNKQIVLTGAMTPYSIEKVEPVSNLMLSIGFLQTNDTNGIYIGMHGLVMDHKKIKKNRTLGVFECL